MTDKSLAHGLVQDLIRIEAELGRTPSRAEFLSHSKYQYVNIKGAFGSYTEFLHCAGRSKKKKKQADKQAIRQKAFEHLKREVVERKCPIPPRITRHALVISDRHKPYHHEDCVPFLLALNAKYKFDRVIDIGDGEDFHAMSFHDHDPDLLSAGHELQAVIEANQPIYRAFPDMDIVDSNHSSLAFRKGKHHGFPRHLLKSYRDVLEAPVGWKWHNELVIQMSDGSLWLFCHSYGDVMKVSQKRAMSTVQGHHHSKFSIQAWTPNKRIYWAVQTGCLVDDDSMAMAYNKTGVDRPVIGTVRIENGIPHLLPMLLDHNGRWTGFVP